MSKVAVVLALALLATAASALSAPTMVAHTKAVVFNAKSMRVTSRQTGYCWTASIASHRGDAYRCMAGNGIHDPCFTLAAHSVACPVDASDNSGIVMTLTKPLPATSFAGNAWQMRLTSGAMCNIGTGTTIPGYPYFCAGGLVCSAPPPGEPHGPIFVHCGPAANGEVKSSGTYLVTTLYE